MRAIWHVELCTSNLPMALEGMTSHNDRDGPLEQGGQAGHGVQWRTTHTYTGDPCPLPCALPPQFWCRLFLQHELAVRFPRHCACALATTAHRGPGPKGTENKLGDRINQIGKRAKLICSTKRCHKKTFVQKVFVQTQCLFPCFQFRGIPVAHTLRIPRRLALCWSNVNKA